VIESRQSSISLTCSDAATFPLVRFYLGSSPIPQSLVASRVRLQLRPLPSAGVTRFPRYLRASPPPHTAQPDSHELPVDPYAITAGASRVAAAPRCLHAAANTPAGPMKPVRSLCSIGVGLPRPKGGSAPALPVSRLAQRLLALRPACLPSRPCDPLHRRLQRLRYLHHCFDCYRAERTSSRAGLPPAVDQRLCTAHFRIKVRIRAACSVRTGTTKRRPSADATSLPPPGSPDSKLAREHGRQHHARSGGVRCTDQSAEPIQKQV
jgi:hypothetical protein